MFELKTTQSCITLFQQFYHTTDDDYRCEAAIGERKNDILQYCCVFLNRVPVAAYHEATFMSLTSGSSGIPSTSRPGKIRSSHVAIY